MRPEDALHGVFETFGNAAFKTSSWHPQMAQVKMCYRHLENVFKIEIKTSSKRLYLNFKSKTWSRLQCVFKVFQPNASKTSLWRLQIIHVLKTSSTGLYFIRSCNFILTVKYWIRLEHRFKNAALQRTSWRQVRVPAGLNAQSPNQLSDAYVRGMQDFAVFRHWHIYRRGHHWYVYIHVYVGWALECAALCIGQTQR